MAKKTQDTLITAAEAARQSNQHRSTVTRYIQEGLLPSVDTPRGNPRIWQSDWDEFLKVTNRLYNRRAIDLEPGDIVMNANGQRIPIDKPRKIQKGERFVTRPPKTQQDADSAANVEVDEVVATNDETA